MDIYYKIQYFDKISMAWKDIQKGYENIEECRKNLLTSKKCRIVKREGRKMEIVK